MDRFLYYVVTPFSRSGVTVRIEALVGGIHCYASDINRRPNSTDYIWALLITDYDDVYLVPSTLGHIQRNYRLYIALQGVNASNTFTLNTTIGDTSIQSMRFKIIRYCFISSEFHLETNIIYTYV